jgi:hypothetical protein
MMRATFRLEAGLALLVVGVSSGAGAQSAPEVCDPLHPGYFTYVQERRESGPIVGATSFDLYEPFGYRDGDPVTDAEAKLVRALSNEAGLQMTPCLQGDQFLPGRFRIGERSEIVIAFDPLLVKKLSGQIGRVDVSGKVITGGVTSREIEIPGYREIGKATPAMVDQFARSEALIADVLLMLRLGSELKEASAVYEDKNSWLREKGEKGQQNIILQKPDREAAGRMMWALSSFYPNREPYLASFTNLLANGDTLSRSERALTPAAAAALRQTLTVAQLGKRVLEAQEASLKELREKIARSREELERLQADIFFPQLRHLATWLGQSPVVGSPEFIQFSAGLCSGGQFPELNNEWCSEKSIPQACSTAVKITSTLCARVTPGGPKKLAEAEAQKNLLQVAELYESVKKALAERAARYPKELEVIDAAAVQEHLLTVIDKWSSFPDAAPQKAQDLLRVSRTSPHFRSFIDELRTLNTLASGDNTQAVLEELRNNIVSVEVQGFREVRLQPRIVGASDGDVIEITIRYLPPGAQPEPAPGQAAATPAPSAVSDGRLRTASWTLRLLVEKVGWYVLAGPRLSMNFSTLYTPEAENLRGTWGTLSLGVGADITYFPGRDASPGLRTLLSTVSGVGLRVDQLDFDARQATEFGIEGHLLLFRGMLTAGVGFNTAVFPIKSGRPIYVSIGLGLERVLDEALRLADDSKR